VDAVAPLASISPPARKKRSQRSAWRTLRGRVTDAKPSSGIKRVQVAASIRRGRHCQALRPKGFAPARCKARARWVSATVKGGRWHLALRGLGRGAARFRVRARDNAGNLQKRAFSFGIRLVR
jgi:hypothetical protein